MEGPHARCVRYPPRGRCPPGAPPPRGDAPRDDQPLAAVRRPAAVGPSASAHRAVAARAGVVRGRDATVQARPRDMGCARRHHDRRRVRAASRARPRRAAEPGRHAARRLRADLCRRRRGPRRRAIAALCGQGVSRAGRRPVRGHRIGAPHVRGRGLRRMVDRRQRTCSTPPPSRRTCGRRPCSASTPSASSPRCRSCSCRFTRCWRRCRRGAAFAASWNAFALNALPLLVYAAASLVLLGFGLATMGLGLVLALPLWAASSYAAWKDIFGVRDAPAGA